MDIYETMQSWGWRIKKAGYTQTAFAKKLNIHGSLLGGYIRGKLSPSVKRFDLIETELKKLGV